MKRLLSLCLAFGLFALPVEAQERFSTEEKAAIEQIVRDYILEHPEILPQAIENLQRREEQRRIAAAKSELKPDAASIAVGAKTPEVTVVEFMDFRCSYCRRSFPDVQRLIQDTDGLRVIYKQFPILDGPGESLSYDLARMGAAAARQRKYAAFHRAMFTAKSRVVDLDEAFDIAREIGLDVTRLKKDMADPKIAEAIDGNLELGRELRLSGTPAYVIGNRIVSGAVGYKALSEAVAVARTPEVAASGSE